MPQTEAKQKFQAKTAIGKLKAVMQPTTPSGCHNSCNLWSGLSLGIVSPYSCLLRPVAKSHISIASWTSPSASETIFLASLVITLAKLAFWFLNSLPNSLIISPLFGAGMSRHFF